MSYYDELKVEGHATSIENGIARCECGWSFDPKGRRWSPTIKAWEHREKMSK